MINSVQFFFTNQSPVIHEGFEYLCAKKEIFQTVLQLGLRQVGDRLYYRPFFNVAIIHIHILQNQPDQRRPGQF
jgi:hypothetical protein